MQPQMLFIFFGLPTRSPGQLVFLYLLYMAGLGSARLGSARFGSARFGSAPFIGSARLYVCM